MPVRPNFVFNFYLMGVAFLVFNKLTQNRQWCSLQQLWTLILSFDVFDFTILAILYTDQILIPTNIKVIKLVCLNLVVVQFSV